MKKFYLLYLIIPLFVLICGCNNSDKDIEKVKEEVRNPKLSCTTEREYLDEGENNYYIEGNCVNEGSRDYDYVQIEYTCYDAEGYEVEKIIEKTTDIKSGSTWNFKASVFSLDADDIHHCDYDKVTGW